MARHGRDVHVPARDGYPLAGSFFEGTSDDGVVLASGTGVGRGFYRRFASYLSERGPSVLSFDYRGVGDSAPERLRGFQADMVDWARLDIAGALAWIQDRCPGRTLFIGHSFGGQAVGLLPDPSVLDRVLLVNAQSGSWRCWRGWRRLPMFLLWFSLIPASTALFGRMPGAVMPGMADLPKGVARQWAHWGRHRDYILRDQDPAGYAAVRAPLRAYSFSDDRLYAPRPAVEQLLSWYAGADVEHRHVDTDRLGQAVGHFGFFRSTSRDTLWSEAAAWLTSG